MDEREEIVTGSSPDEKNGMSQKNGDVSPKSRKFAQLFSRERLPVLAVYARYVLPFVGALAVLLLSCFDLIYFYMVGVSYKMSLFGFMGSTLSAAVEYLRGKGDPELGSFYALQSIGALLSLLLLLAALFFAGFAAVTAVRAFRAGHESRESNRMKVMFKILFPNRVALFVADLVLVLPTLYPYLFAGLGKYFGSGGVLFVTTNVPLIVSGIFTVLTLVLALMIPRFERQKKMNMFLVHDDGEESKEENEE